MTLSYRRLVLPLGLLSLTLGCAAPLDKPLSESSRPAILVDAQVVDLRADSWKKTQVLQNAVGVVQHLGDDRLPGTNLPQYVAQELADLLNQRGVKRFAVKTADIRLSIPGAKLDQVQLANMVATTGLIAAPVMSLLSTFERNKSASAVFCVSLDGRDYLGNDARLFSFGAEGELKDSLSAALAVLKQNVAAGKSSTSPACDPGWEGGQPR